MHHDRVAIGGLKLHLTDWGGAGLPPLFLVHGLASTRHMFDLIAPPLTARCHVFAYDQRGHGESDKPDDGYDFETIAGDLDRLADALGFAGERLAVVGHSWGAYSALYYAATRPARTARAVLLDGGIRPLQARFPTWAEGEIGLSPPSYEGVTLADLPGMIRRWQGAGYRPETEPLAMTIYDVSDPQHVRAHLSRASNLRIARALWQFQPAAYLPHVDCPLLIVNAVPPGETADPLAVQAAAQAQALVRDVRIVWMPETIHDIPWHRPAELSALLATFL